MDNFNLIHLSGFPLIAINSVTPHTTINIFSCWDNQGHSHVAGLLYIVDIQVDFTVDYHCQNTSTKRTGRLCVSSVAKKMPIEFSVLEHAG
ncbi:unnamed protein product [Schistosoma curassoni]|nr:unnamed protein product [Schistosoma curassoni]